MSNVEHYFENLVLDGCSDIKGLNEEVRDAVEDCAAYVIYTMFDGLEDVGDFVKGKTCSRCSFSVEHDRGNGEKLYECLNTEIDMRSWNNEKFGCTKWENML